MAWKVPRRDLLQMKVAKESYGLWSTILRFLLSSAAWRSNPTLPAITHRQGAFSFCDGSTGSMPPLMLSESVLMVPV